MATIKRTGPGLFTRVCAERLQREDEGEAGGDAVLLLPPQWFYALPNTEAEGEDEQGQEHRRRRDRWVAPGVTHAIHHWARSWQQAPGPASS